MHNPQEDEPVGEYEEQDLAMPNQIDKLDRLFQNFYSKAEIKASEIGWELISEQEQEFKTEILKHYISREEVLGLIGEDEPSDWRQQREHTHISWEKVKAIDETYWRCMGCLVTADSPVSPTWALDAESKS